MLSLSIVGKSMLLLTVVVAIVVDDVVVVVLTRSTVLFGSDRVRVCVCARDTGEVRIVAREAKKPNQRPDPVQADIRTTLFVRVEDNRISTEMTFRTNKVQTVRRKNPTEKPLQTSIFSFCSLSLSLRHNETMSCSHFHLWFPVQHKTTTTTTTTTTTAAHNMQDKRKSTIHNNTQQYTTKDNNMQWQDGQ